MNESNDQGLIHEIEEDLQRQRLTNFWNKYGTMIIVAALALVLGTAASSGWRTYNLNKNQAASAALMEITQASQKEGRVAALEEFVKTNQSNSQAVLARLFAAQAAMDDGKRERAIAFYDALAADDEVEPVFRGLADILSVMAQFDTSDPKTLEARLAPISKNGPWHGLASEMMGHLALKMGDHSKALQIFKGLVANKDISQGVQRRAADLYQWLKDKA